MYVVYYFGSGDAILKHLCVPMATRNLFIYLLFNKSDIHHTFVRMFKSKVVNSYTQKIRISTINTRITFIMFAYTYELLIGG